MKGDISLGVIAAIIFLFIILGLIVLVFLTPIWETGETIEPTRDFWFYCIFWRERSYAGTSVVVDGEEIDMGPLCANQVGTILMPPESSDPQGLWEKCRDRCRFSQTGG
jgi:hypothetical protein